MVKKQCQDSENKPLCEAPEKDEIDKGDIIEEEVCQAALEVELYEDYLPLRQP